MKKIRAKLSKETQRVVGQVTREAGRVGDRVVAAADKVIDQAVIVKVNHALHADRHSAEKILGEMETLNNDMSQRAANSETSVTELTTQLAALETKIKEIKDANENAALQKQVVDLRASSVSRTAAALASCKTLYAHVNTNFTQAKAARNDISNAPKTTEYDQPRAEAIAKKALENLATYQATVTKLLGEFNTSYEAMNVAKLEATTHLNAISRTVTDRIATQVTVPTAVVVTAPTGIPSAAQFAELQRQFVEMQDKMNAMIAVMGAGTEGQPHSTPAAVVFTPPSAGSAAAPAPVAASVPPAVSVASDSEGDTSDNVDMPKNPVSKALSNI